MASWSGVPTSRDPPSDIDLSKWKRIEIGSDIFNQPILVAYWSPRFQGAEEATRKAYSEAVKPARKTRDEALEPARKAYYIEAVESAWKAYNKVAEPVRKAYNEAVKSAQKAYADAVEPVEPAEEKAYDEAVKSAEKAYDEAVEPVGKAYDEAVKFAEKAYDEVMEPARKAYNEAAESVERAYNEAQAHAAAKYLFHPPATEYVLYRGDEDLWVRTKSVDGATRLFIDAASEMRAGAGELKTRLERQREFAAKGVTLARFDPGKVFVRRHARRRR